MRSVSIIIVFWLATMHSAMDAEARVWTDTTSQYTLEAELVAASDSLVLLQRADHELVAIAIEMLSAEDQEFLNSPEANEQSQSSADAPQTWTLLDETKVSGRIVDYARRSMTLQRRRGRTYVNDRVLDNLPEFYQLLIPRIVAHAQNLRRDDRRSLENWLIRQRGQPQTLELEGVILETDNGDEYAIPFFLIAEDDRRVLESGWHEWLVAQGGDNTAAQENQTFLVQSLAAARHRDRLVEREIAMLQLKLQAVQAGFTSLWEVTLYPGAGQIGTPQWVVVPGRDSRQATANALRQFPGFVVGPVRRVARR